MICIKNFIFHGEIGKKENSKVPCILAVMETRWSGTWNALQQQDDKKQLRIGFWCLLRVFVCLFCFVFVIFFLSLASEIVDEEQWMVKGEEALHLLDNELFSSKGLWRIMGFFGLYFAFLSLCVWVFFSANSRVSGLKTIELSFLLSFLTIPIHFDLTICGSHCQGFIF